MNPSTDVRIDSMVRALADFIIPELSAGGTGADQAALVLAHLQVLRAQVDIAPDFERYELTHSALEAETVLELAEGGSHTTTAVTNLRAALDNIDDSNAPAIRRSTESIRSGLEQLVRAVAEDGSPVSAGKVSTVVLRFERTLATANRAFFAGNGWEAADTDIPDIATLLERT